MLRSGFLLFAFALIAVVFADPNEEFAECCKGKSVPDSCIKYCTYDFTPPPALKFFRKKPKFSDGDECYADDVMTSVMQCSQKDKDNTECCKTAGVGNEHDFCLELCDGTKPITNNEKYAECEDVANKVKECGKNA
uniref:Domain of unknown function DB domain-containing protein n=1 Tax=Panagrolaimus davidi TaxID=227884 RepID=A0A914Q6J3_9BILA